MPSEITIPRLGWSMEEGTFVNWLKRDGQWVAKGDQLFVLESEKAAQEIESLDEGLLAVGPDAPRPGDTVKVGQVIGFLLAKGETAPHISPRGDASPETNGPARGAAPPAGPGVRRLARQLNVAIDALTGSGPRGRIIADDVHIEAAHRSSPSATSKTADREQHGDSFNRQVEPGSSVTAELAAVTPRARRVASEIGVDPTALRGTGRGGRIRERDVRAAAAAKPIPAEAPARDEPGTVIQAGSIRRTIARRMVESHQSTAPVTLTSRADATNLVSLRKQFQTTVAEGSVVPSITDLLVKLAALALERHPRLNARWQADGIVEVPEIHIGIAVDTDSGLLVPVMRDARRLGVRQIAVRARELADRARRGALTAAELQGGTFTITNLGVYGIDAFTPIINPPETAILGVGAIRREAVCVDADRIVPRDQMTLSLTFDHRVVDGAPAARFLQTLVQAIESPAAWLME